MADQGLLAQSKPAAATNTLLYAAPVDRSASTVLSIANDGTGSAYDVAIKDYDQKLTVDGSGAYLLHPGDVITGYRFTVDQNLGYGSNLTAGIKLMSDDYEKTFKFESFYIPAVTDIFVKEIEITALTLSTPSGTFAIGDTITEGVSPDQVTAVIYDVETTIDTTIIYIGPQTLSGAGDALAPGDSISTAGGASATIASGGVGTPGDRFIYSDTTIGGTYGARVFSDRITLYTDRVYRFDVSDSSMTGRDFKLSGTENGEWGPDGTFNTIDDGAEYTTGKTTNGTPGSASAWIQYDLTSGTPPSPLYVYDGGTGTASNSGYGGGAKSFDTSSIFQYTEFYAYDVEGTWANNVDTFTQNGVTYTITAQTSGPYGYVRSYSGTDLKVIKGLNSASFAGTDTFQDNPKLANATRSTVTVSSVDVDVTAVEDSNYIVKDGTNSANNVDRITSLVIGPGERLIVESATQNNVFSLIGFEDLSTAFATRNVPLQNPSDAGQGEGMGEGMGGG